MGAREYATVAALSDDPTLVRVARHQLDAAAAAEEKKTMSTLQDAAVRVIDGVSHKWTATPKGWMWLPYDELVSQQVGTPLRDAAVDPAEGDIGPYVRDVLDPDRDPHGPNVVSAEVGSLAYQRDVDEARRARGETVPARGER